MATSGQKELKTKWPVEEGTTFGTTKLADNWILVPQESNILDKDKIGIR